MRNILDKSCREIKNRLSVFITFFSTIVPFMRERGKIWQNQTGHMTTIQRGAEKARFACRLTKARIRTHAGNI